MAELLSVGVGDAMAVALSRRLHRLSLAVALRAG